MANGVVKAVLDRYATLDAANFPAATRTPVYFAQPTTGFALPSVFIRDCRVRAERIDAREVMETHTLAWEIYAESAADCDTILAAILYDGDGVGERGGFEDAETLTGLPAGYRLDTCCRGAGDSERREFAQWSPAVERAFVLRWSLEIGVIAGNF